MVDISEDWKEAKNIRYASSTIVNDLNDAIEEADGDKEIFCDLASASLNRFKGETEDWLESVEKYCKGSL